MLIHNFCTHKKTRLLYGFPLICDFRNESLSTWNLSSCLTNSMLHRLPQIYDKSLIGPLCNFYILQPTLTKKKSVNEEAGQTTGEKRKALENCTSPKYISKKYCIVGNCTKTSMHKRCKNILHIEPSHPMTMRMCQNISKSQRETLNFSFSSFGILERRTCNNAIESRQPL